MNALAGHRRVIRMDDSSVSRRAYLEVIVREATARSCIQRLNGQISILEEQVCRERAATSLMRVEIERMQLCQADFVQANNELAASVGVSRLQSEPCQCALPGNENIDDLPPVPSSSSGGGPGGIQCHPDGAEHVQSSPPSDTRRFTGDGSNRSTRIRWKNFALNALSRFSSEQLRITISGLYADLLKDRVCLSSALLDAFERNSDTFEALLPPGFLTERLLKCQEDFVAAMTEHWSTARCLDIKIRNWLSREKYDQVRRSLSNTFVDGVWVHKSHNGTLFPVLCSRYSLDKVCRVIANESGLKKFAGGLGASVDIRKLVQVWFIS